MAWKQTCAVEERFRFIEDYRSEHWTVADLCRRYGVSRETGYKWLERYEAEGWAGLQDRSRAPERHPNEVIAEVAEAVLEMRRDHAHWGAAKLRARLQREAPEIAWPAPSTIGELLKREGLTAPRRKRRKAAPTQNPLADCTQPNQVWCADFKGWFLCQDGSRCDPLTITDAHSRYLLRCQALEGMDERRARAVMEAAFREYGLPERMRKDNREPFASVGIAGLSSLSVWWMQLGIRPERIQPGKPQQNGRHERMHRTLKQATAHPPAANLRAQQRAFDRFRHEYNEERPHQALEMRPPADFYQPSCRTFPSRLSEPDYCGEWNVRSVGPCGTMRWKNQKLFVGKVLAGQLIGLQPVSDSECRL